MQAYTTHTTHIQCTEQNIFSNLNFHDHGFMVRCKELVYHQY